MITSIDKSIFRRSFGYGPRPKGSAGKKYVVCGSVFNKKSDESDPTFCSCRVVLLGYSTDPLIFPKCFCLCSWRFMLQRMNK